MEEIKLHLDKKKIAKLMKGKLCQLKPDNLKDSNCSLALHAENAKKVKRARKAGKGVRLTLSPAEIEASVGGEGIKEVWEKIKSGAKKVKGFYDDNLKASVAPILRKLVKEGKDKAIDGLKAYNPAVGMAVDYVDDRIGDKAVDSLGRLSGAFGKKGRKPRNVGVSEDSSSVYDPKIIPNPNLYMIPVVYSGGSFKAMNLGGSFKH